MSEKLQRLTKADMTEAQRAFAQENGLSVPGLTICRSDGRCQYAIDHGAEGLGHCPRGKCVMPDHGGPVA